MMIDDQMKLHRGHPRQSTYSLDGGWRRSHTAKTSPPMHIIDSILIALDRAALIIDSRSIGWYSLFIWLVDER